MPENRKAYSYLRFSTPEQMKGDSFRRQTSMATAYAATHGLDLDLQLTRPWSARCVDWLQPYAVPGSRETCGPEIAYVVILPPEMLGVSMAHGGGRFRLGL